MRKQASVATPFAFVKGLLARPEFSGRAFCVIKHPTKGRCPMDRILRLVAVLLAVSVFFCVPASASAETPYTIDLTGGSFSVTNAQVALDVRLSIDKAVNQGTIKTTIAYLDMNGRYYLETDIDLNCDDSYDVRLAENRDSNGLPYELTFTLLQTNSIDARCEIAAPGTTYDPLVFILKNTESGEPALPALYSDATGYYTIADGEATYQKPAKTSITAGKIPDTISVLGTVVPVTKIGPGAFRMNQKKLTKVTIGKNVREIGNNAFFK